MRRFRNAWEQRRLLRVWRASAAAHVAATDRIAILYASAATFPHANGAGGHLRLRACFSGWLHDTWQPVSRAPLVEPLVRWIPSREIDRRLIED